MMGKWLASVIIFFGAITLVVLLSALYAFPTMWIWNGTLVAVFSGMKAITFWQAWGLNLLAGILFKSTSSNTSVDSK